MKPLDGITVVELARVAPGRFCTKLLADMGADVVAVRAPSDAARDAYLDRGKRDLAIDLKTAEGRAALHELAATADVVLDGLSPDAATRLGADHATLTALNPRLIHCAMTAFGQDGPYRDRPAHDLNLVGLAGMLGLSGDVDGRPALHPRLIADFGGAALFAAIGILLAVIARTKTGRGQQVDVAYLDSAFALLACLPQARRFMAGDAVPERAPGIASGAYAYYGVYACADGRWISLACLEPGPWARLCELLDLPALKALGHDPRDHVRAAGPEQAEARQRLEAAFRVLPADAWMSRLAEARVTAARVNTLREAFDDPQLVARGMVKDGIAGNPIRLSDMGSI